MTDDEVAQALLDDADAINAQRMWALGLYSDREMLDIFKARRTWIGETPIEVEEEWPYLEGA